LQALEAESADCDAELVASLRDTVGLACGKLQPDLKEFRKAWDRAAALLRAEGTELDALTPRWARWDGRWRARYHRVEHLPLLALFEPQSGQVVLATYEVRALCRERARQTGVAYVRQEELAADDSTPRLLERVEPEFPEPARRGQRSGVVLLWYVVDAVGAVGTTCLVAASPHGHGFVEAATAAVERWRYEPATMDGVPVAAEVLTEVVFENRPTPLPWGELLAPFFLTP
jgi:TonB family protein